MVIEVILLQYKIIPNNSLFLNVFSLASLGCKIVTLRMGENLNWILKSGVGTPYRSVFFFIHFFATCEICERRKGEWKGKDRNLER